MDPGQAALELPMPGIPALAGPSGREIFVRPANVQVT